MWSSTRNAWQPGAVEDRGSGSRTALTTPVISNFDHSDGHAGGADRRDDDADDANDDDDSDDSDDDGGDDDDDDHDHGQ